MTGIFRGVAYAAWMLAFGLSIWLAVEFHEYHIGIALGVAILALILSAFGLLMARSCGQQKDRLAMTIGIVLWAAGAISFAITELGFWSSSYKDRHAEYVQVKTAKARQEGMKDMAWDALRTGEMRASTAEIEARIKAARQSELYASSAGCTNATAKKSREFCGSYYELEAKLASAGKMETLEARLLGDKTDAKQTMVHNVFAAADLIAENSTFTEKQAATIVVLTIALVLMLARDLLLIVANPFGGATAALGAAKASDPISVAPAPVAAVLAPPATPRAPMKVWAGYEKIAGVNLPEIPDGSEPSKELGQNTIPSNDFAPKKASEEITPPDGPGTPIAKPEEPKIEEVADISNVVPLKGYHDSGADWRIEKDVPEKRSKKRAQETSVSRWLRGFDVRDLTPEEVKAGKGFFAKSYLKQYEAWCRAHKENPFKLKKFSAVLRGELDQPKKRRAGGQRFNVALEPVMAQARRKVA